MAQVKTWFGSIGPLLSQDDGLREYGFETTGKGKVDVAPTLSEEVMRLTDFGASVVQGPGASTLNALTRWGDLLGVTLLDSPGLTYDNDGILHLDHSKAGGNTLRIENSTDDPLTQSFIRLQAVSDSSYILQHGPSASGSRYGKALAGAFEIFGDVDGLILGTGASNGPIVFGISSLEKARFEATGLHVSNRLGVGIAPTIDFHVQKDDNSAILNRIENLNAGASAAAQFDARADGGRVSLLVNSSGRTGTRFGLAKADLAVLVAQDGAGSLSGFAVGTEGSYPLVFGTNGLERGRFGSGGKFRMQEQILADVGTDALPGYAFEGQDDAGISLLTGNQLLFSLSGAEVARITNTGIGYGVNPTEAFDVVGNVKATGTANALAGYLVTELGAHPSTPSSGKVHLYALTTPSEFWGKNDLGEEMGFAWIPSGESYATGSVFAAWQTGSTELFATPVFINGLGNVSAVADFTMTGVARLTTTDAEIRMTERSVDGGALGVGALYAKNGSVYGRFGLDTPVDLLSAGGAFDLGDDEQGTFGASDDVVMQWVSATNRFSVDLATQGDIRIKHGTETMVLMTADGSVDQYHDGTVRTKTTGSGFDVHGDLGFAANFSGPAIELPSTITQTPSDGGAVINIDHEVEPNAALPSGFYGVHSQFELDDGVTARDVAFVRNFAGQPRSKATYGGDVTNWSVFQAQSGATTILGSGTITNLTGFSAGNFVDGTNNYGFKSTMTAGANKWSFYDEGGAGMYLLGDLEVDGEVQLDNAVIKLTNIPTSNPGGSGRIWSDSGTLKIT